jgi:hypothetical protein
MHLLTSHDVVKRMAFFCVWVYLLAKVSPMDGANKQEKARQDTPTGPRPSFESRSQYSET